MKEREIFDAALAIVDPGELDAFLSEACGGNAALEEHVRKLLGAQRELGSFLEDPAHARTISVESSRLTEGPGTVIGPYNLLEQIGEGGMGTVYMAEQTAPVKRVVALKVIKAGMDSRHVLARFGAERQALALMDHPNIARVLDAGATEQGRPYFVMELVKGVPITRFCDEKHLTPRARLELFIPICQAIQHAHQKGIIHRDLKPSNVLVGLYDGQPVPKIIDFGVAKAAGPRLTEATLFTGFGTVIGTPEYMSPEQAQLDNLDIDTRSDIYSLGVLLYELLAGTTPFTKKDLEKAGLLEMLRMIREREPTKPSTTLSTAEGLPSLAASRGTEPAKLTRLVRGELDWIVMKALEKDRNRRYATAAGFAADLQRQLNDEPVLACPPSTGYRLRKFLRRNKRAVLAALLVLMVLVAGIIGTTWGLIRAEQAWRAEARQRALAAVNEQKALEQKRIAEAVRNFLQQDLLRQANPAEQADAIRQMGGGFETTANPTIKEVLDRAARELMPGKIEAKFPQQQEVQASILQTVGATYTSIGEFAKAVEFLTRSSDTYRHALGPDHPDTLATLLKLAGAYLLAGRTAEAVALYERVRDACVRTLGASHPETLSTLHGLAMAYLHAGRTAEAVALFERVRDARVQELGADHPDTLITLHGLAEAYRMAGKTAESTALYERVRDACAKTLGSDHPLTLIALHGLAGAYLSVGRMAEGVALYERERGVCVRTLGADHPFTLGVLQCLADVYRVIGKPAEAIALCERVHDARLKKLGPDHPLTLVALQCLAGAYRSAGRTAEAVSLYERVRHACARTFGADGPQTLVTLHGLAEAYLAAGRVPEAINLLERVRDARVKQLGADHPFTLDTLHSLARAYQAAAKPEQASAVLLQAALGSEKRHFVDSSAGPIVADLIFDYFERLKQYDQAEVWQRKWLAVVKERSGADSIPFATESALLGWNLLKQKRWNDAEAMLRECLVVREKREPDAWTTFNTRSMLGEALYGQKKYAEAGPLLVQGYEGMKLRAARIPKEGKPRIAQALERLVQLYTAWGKSDEAARWRTVLESEKAGAGAPDPKSPTP